MRWHYHLGHLSFAKLKQLALNGEVPRCLAKVKPPACVGCLFDVGNILPFGYPEMWIRALEHRIVAVHVKDFKRAVGTAEGFCDLCEGDVNFEEVVKALGEIGFDGALVAEMIPHYPRYPMGRVANTSNALDAILGR
jgi:hexulose-6-phosphate isomerase